MNTNAAKLLMALVILTRSSAFIFSKFAMEELSTFQTLGFRFTLACLLMGAALYRHIAQALREDKSLVKKSCLLGSLLFCIMGCEMQSLRTAEVHTVAFLENLSLALVPLFLAVWYRKLPKVRILQGAGFILLGVAALTIGGTGFTLAGGEGWALLAAVFYALYIIATGKLAAISDGKALGILQMGFMGLLSFAAALVQEGSVFLPTRVLTWESLAFLVLVCSCFGFTFQPVAQRYISAEETGMYCAINPLFASLLGHWVFEETFGPTAILGAVYILTGLVFVNWPEQKTHGLPRQAIHAQQTADSRQPHSQA
ncbi:DMT family transporter [Acidaminococcus sp.]|uniref:DMT family transporter n=1 Tax=Acidaminococcus sp. TaxID=1872103 RepID=UPI003D7D7DE6